jgi:phosphatidylserine/phosphatidylglycerophosphate/cardiolipin synthase-like enzyme
MMLRFWLASSLLFTTACVPVVNADPSGSGIEVAFSPKGGATDLVVQAINDAHSSIRLVGYSFTSVPIAKALIAKHKDGCDIQVVLDKSNATENYSAATLLYNAGIPVRIDSKHAITHDKYMVIDGAEVETGSFNYTAAAETSNAENVLVIRNQPALATKYLANWQVLWSESKPYQGIGK